MRIEIRASQTDDFAPLAYLGRVTRSSRSWRAEQTDWSDSSIDPGPTNTHYLIGVFTGANAEEKAGQAVLDNYEAWKRTRPRVMSYAEILKECARGGLVEHARNVERARNMGMRAQK